MSARSTAKANLTRSKKRKGRPMDQEKRGAQTERGGNGSPRKGGAEAAVAGGANLEKIRDILFGAQVHDFEKRFARLEERLLKETSDARAETKKRFDTLEGFIRKEIEALGERLKSEQEERADAVKEISKELRDSARSLDKRIAQLDEVTSKNQRELRQQVLDQSKALTEEIRARNKETTTLLSKEIGELRVGKTDRAALAGLLTDLAVRLSNESKSSAKS